MPLFNPVQRHITNQRTLPLEGRFAGFSIPQRRKRKDALDRHQGSARLPPEC